jgi:Mrp family chromosome partitioning ATPase
VVEVLGAADLIDQLQALGQRLLGVVEELRLIVVPVGP